MSTINTTSTIISALDSTIPASLAGKTIIDMEPSIIVPTVSTLADEVSILTSNGFKASAAGSTVANGNTRNKELVLPYTWEEANEIIRTEDLNKGNLYRDDGNGGHSRKVTTAYGVTELQESFKTLGHEPTADDVAKILGLDRTVSKQQAYFALDEMSTIANMSKAQLAEMLANAADGETFVNDLINSCFQQVYGTYFLQDSHTGLAVGNTKIKSKKDSSSKKDYNQVNTVSDSYESGQYATSIEAFFDLIEKIRQAGYEVTPAYGKSMKGGASMFLQYKIGGAQIHGEPCDVYLAMVDSHDKSFPIGFYISVVRLFCQNQLNHLLQDSKKNFIQLTASHQAQPMAAIEQLAKNALKAKDDIILGLNARAEELLKVRISDEQIYNLFKQINAPEGMLTPQVLRNSYHDNMIKLFRAVNSPDLANFRGTAYGLMQAVADISQHGEPSKSTNSESYIRESFMGEKMMDSWNYALANANF